MRMPVFGLWYNISTMQKSRFFCCLLAGVIFFQFSFSSDVFAKINREFLLSDEEMTDTTTMTKQEIQAFLKEQGSYLASYQTIDIRGIKRYASEIISRVANAFDLNPRVLLVMLQKEQSLIENKKTTKDRLDWAMGYSICDTCSKRDQRLKKYKGFAKQVFYAAERIRESYLTDLKKKGKTISGIGPGKTTTIDGEPIVPKNAATAVLYTYTPHFDGNEKFVRIWRDWFVPDYPDGSLLQDKTNGGVWLIQNSVKRPITSRAVLLSRFNEKNIIKVQPSVLETFERGPAISFQNYSLLRAPNGDIHLLSDETLRWITSGEIFRGIGFNLDDVIDVSENDLTPFAVGTPIDSIDASAQGVLIQNLKNGGVYFVEAGVKHPIPSPEVLKARFDKWPMQKKTEEDLTAYATGTPVVFPDGTLVAEKGSKTIFVISHGKKRKIADDAFKFYGWNKSQIVYTNNASLALHEQGEDVVKRADETSER